MPSAVSSTDSRLESLRALAWDLGFDHCRLAPLTISDADRAAYLDWCAAGGAAGMAYMTRDPEARAGGAALLEGARSVLSLAVSYYQGPLPPKPGPGYGRVARYAWGRDYHPIILERLERLLALLPERLGVSVVGAPAVDTRALLERAVARAAGLGFTGKNTVTILPQGFGSLRFHVGSWVFLAEIVLDLEVAASPPPSAAGCGGCTKCLTACPTDAFDGPYRLNAGRCIAYLTIENKGPIPLEMRAAVGDWVFGCDVCQDVCPFNARAFETRWPDLRAESGVGPWLPLTGVLDDGARFKERFGATPLARARRRGLARNACVVAGNSGDASLSPLLRSLIHDPEPLVRSHALWGLSRLDPAASRTAAERLRSDADPEVRAEAAAVLESP